MTASPVDTIREATVRNGVCLICGSAVLNGEHLRDDPCALTEVEQQLDDHCRVANEMEQLGIGAMRMRDDALARAVAAETALADAERRAKLEYQTRMDTRAMLVAAEQRAVDLADALRAIADAERWVQAGPLTDVARAALDRHTKEVVT